VFAKEDQAKKDAVDESDDESAISRTESELREVTKVLLHHTLRLLLSQDKLRVFKGCYMGKLPNAVLYHCCKTLSSLRDCLLDCV